MAAQGRSLLLTQGHRAKGGWWGAKRWAQLQVKLPAWLEERLEVFRRLLATLTAELDVATAALEAAAPAERPRGLGGTDLILLKNLLLLFGASFGRGWGQADQTQIRTRQQLPSHRFPSL